MVARLRMLGLVLFIVLGALSPGFEHRATDAQYGPLLAVYVDPTTAAPGEWVDVTVIANGSGSHVSISVNVPTELTIGDDLRCVHRTSYCNGVSSTEGGLVTASAPGILPGPDGYGGSTQVYLSFPVLVPQSAASGTRYQINATMVGLFNILQPEKGKGARTSAVLTVGSVSGRQPTPTFSPAANTGPVSQEASDAQLVIVGRTEVQWTGDWQYEANSSTDEYVQLSQVDAENIVIRFAFYGELHNDTVESPSALLDTYFDALFQEGSLADSPAETESGELEDGTLWRTYTLAIEGLQLTLLVTVSEATDGAYIFSALISNTEAFENSLAIAQREILLNGNAVFLNGIDAEMLGR